MEFDGMANAVAKVPWTGTDGSDLKPFGWYAPEHLI